MVGFPGETEEQFEELVDFVKLHPLDNVGIFKFSAEAGAHASKLPDQIPDDVKEARYVRLANAQMEVVEQRTDRFIGKRLKVMVEGYHPESELLMRGRFNGQCPEIDGQVIINDGRKVTAFGQLYEVEITDVAGYDLIGRVIKACSTPVPEKKLALV